MAGIAAAVPRDVKTIGLVCFPHMLSHAYYLVLAPLFPVLKTELGVSNTELGLVMTIFGIVAGVGQTPMGFLVDRFSPRPLLIAGLATQSLTIGMIGLVTDYWQLVGLFAIAGIAHTVYHPADYAILSAIVPRQRLGRAFGIHSLTGNIGFALAPVLMVAVTELWGWRAAFFVIGGIGLIFSVILWWHGDLIDIGKAAERRAQSPPEDSKDRIPASLGKEGVALLLSLPILMCFVYFVVQMMGLGGLRTFLVAALDAQFGTPLAAVNTALTGLLIGSAFGILAGAQLADRYGPRMATAFATLLPAALLVVVVGAVEMPILPLTAVLAATGFLQGFLVPSRDLLIRSVTPDGSMGKVMGFVSSGANLAGGLVPLMFGWILDNFSPDWIFWISALFIACALFTFVTVKGRLA